MPLRSFLLFFVFLYRLAPAQKNELNLVIGAGGSYFFNETSAHHYLDHTTTLGINYAVTKKKDAFIFNPGLNYQAIAYHTHLDAFRMAQIKQYFFTVSGDVLMRVSKKNYLRVGLLLCKEVGSTIFITHEIYNNGQYMYSNSQMNHGYAAARFQAGITLGICLPFTMYNRVHKFDIKLVHMATPVVAYDYVIKQPLTGENVTVLSTGGRATMLILALEFKLGKHKKEKTEED